MYTAVFSRVLEEREQKFDLKALDKTTDYSYETCKELLRLAVYLKSSKIEEVDAPYEITHSEWTSDCYWFDVVYRVLQCGSKTGKWARKRFPEKTDDRKQADAIFDILRSTRRVLKEEKESEKWPKKFQALVLVELEQMYYRVRINILLLRASDYPKEEEEHDEPYALRFTAALLERKLNGGVPDTQTEFDALHEAIVYLYRSGSSCIALMTSMLRLYGNIQSTKIAHIQDTVQKQTKLYQQEQREEHPDDRTLQNMHDFMLWCASSEKVKTMKSD
jgi:hypothetical protein